MALKGTLGDFSLADILQLIGLQRKTGVLDLHRDDERISISFDNGRVVAADSTSRPIEDRVGNLLVRTGKLTESRLEAALKIQRETLQRLGHVLSNEGWVDGESIRRQLTLQITETVYELFRWSDGEYDFQPQPEVDWDQEFISPIHCEHLMMEGAQMVDEWPLIERVIPSKLMVLRPTPAAAEVLSSASSESADVHGSVYEDDIDFGFIPTDPLGGEAEEGPAKLSPREVQVLRWIDGQRTAMEIADLTELGTFDAFKTLARLVEAKLVEPVVFDDPSRKSQTPRVFLSAAPARVLGWMLALLVLIGAAAAVQELVLALRPALPRLPLPRPVASAPQLARNASLETARRAASSARLTRVEQALRVYFLSRGRWPRRLDLLADEGLLRRELLRDPWGRPYTYELSSVGYRVSELSSPGGEPAQWREHYFAARERTRELQSDGAGGASAVISGAYGSE